MYSKNKYVKDSITINDMQPKQYLVSTIKVRATNELSDMNECLEDIMQSITKKVRYYDSLDANVFTDKCALKKYKDCRIILAMMWSALDSLGEGINSL